MSRLLFLGCFLLASPVVAQPTKQLPPQPPQRLSEALEHTYWNAAERGPLLALAPERVLIRPQRGRPPVLPPPPPTNGYNALEISAYFNHQPFRAGGVTVVAPKTMRLFTRPKLTLEQGLALSKDNAGAELLASLTSAQWQQLGSEQGLGLGNLSERQKPYFLMLLPTRATLYPTYRPPQPGQPPQQPESPRPLGAAECQSMRLRLSQKLQISYMIEGQPNSGFGFGDDNETQRYSLQLSDGSEEAEDEQNPLQAKLFPRVPNRLKRGELALESPQLRVRVSLSEVKTVGELLTRIGDTTRLTLKSDYRLTNLPLWVRGESALAGDLLQALCLGVCGTFRRITTSTYLLTEDVEGLTVRQAVYEKWQRDIYRLQEKRQEERKKKLKDNGATLVTDNPDGLSDELLKKTERSVSSSLPESERGIPLSQLPAVFQQRMEKASKIEFRTVNSETPSRIRTDRVLLSRQPQTQWVLPGVGTFSAHELSGLSQQVREALRSTEPPSTVPPASGPLSSPNWRERVLTLTAKDAAQAKDAVQLAKEHGFGYLWLTVPHDSAKARTLLEAALVEGKQQGIAVGARLPVLQPISGHTYALDRTVLGEALTTRFGGLMTITPFVEPTVALAQSLGQLLKTLAALPGLAGIALDQNTVPGYDDYASTEEILGYSPENRTAFFQKTGNDILDLGSSFSLPLPLGYFSKTQPDYIPLPNNQFGPDPSFRDLAKEWQEFRKDKLIAFWKALDASLTGLSIPCYALWNSLSLAGRWTLTDTSKLNQFDGVGDYVQGQLARARKLSPRLVLRYVVVGSSLFPIKETDFQSWLRTLATSDSKPTHADGLVVDLGELPSRDEARRLLALLTTPVKPTETP